MLPLQINTQPSEVQELRGDGSLEVIDVFATIQGEGPYAGKPAIFVRLAGCNLQCPACDTQYTEGRKLLTPMELYQKVVEAELPYHSHWKTPLVVITGGEPFRQNLTPFVNLMRSCWWLVQVETNGTEYLDDEDFPWKQVVVVCSPKTPKIHPKIGYWITAWKYIIRAGEVDLKDGLPTSSLGMPHPPYRSSKHTFREVYVQPCDDGDPEKNRANTRECVQSAMKFGYRLSLQMHKIVGLP